MKIVSQKPPLKMYDRLAHRVARSSQATPAAVDKSSSASNTKIQTAPLYKKLGNAMFYLDLFAALHRHEVEYVLIGGLVAAFPLSQQPLTT